MSHRVTGPLRGRKLAFSLRGVITFLLWNDLGAYSEPKNSPNAGKKFRYLEKGVGVESDSKLVRHVAILGQTPLRAILLGTLALTGYLRRQKKNDLREGGTPVLCRASALAAAPG